jgi:hypothetical protein
MRDLTLYRAIAAGTNSANLPGDAGSSDPDSISCIFLEKGHIVEYVQTGARKTVSLFFGPDEYIIPCHAIYSSLKALDSVTTITFTHRNIFRTLRHFPESSTEYQGIRSQYLEKVNERLRMRQTMNAEERFQYLQGTQPWVFSLASRGDITSYLDITVEELRQIAKVHQHSA